MTSLTWCVCIPFESEKATYVSAISCQARSKTAVGWVLLSVSPPPPPPCETFRRTDVLCSSHVCSDGILIPDAESVVCDNNNCLDVQCCEEEPGEQRRPLLLYLRGHGLECMTILCVSSP